MTQTAVRSAIVPSQLGHAGPIISPAAAALSRGGGGVPLPSSGVLFSAPTPILGRQPAPQAENPASGRGTPRLRLSRPLSRPSALPAELAQIRLEIHLDRVTLRGDIALLHLLFRL